MNIGIVGGGLLGRLLAFAAVNDGMRVSVYDDAENSSRINCSMAAAGLLTPVSELEKSPLMIYQLGMESLYQHWPTILKQLNADIFFQKTGSIVLSHPQDKTDLSRLINIIDHKMPQKKLHQSLSQTQLRELEPQLNKFTEAYYFSDEGQLDNRVTLSALKNYCEARGVSWHHAHVDEIALREIRVNQQIKKFDMVFDCRGMNAKNIFKDLQAVRGELLWLYAPDVAITRPIRFMHPRYRLYVAPRPEHVYVVGATEINVENYSEISVRTVLELLTAAFYLHAGFAEASIIKTISHCRPTLPNYLPKIKYADGFMAINGLYRHGFLIAPTIVNEIMLWLKHGKISEQYQFMWEAL